METSNLFICEVCGKEHPGIFGSGRFCSLSCKQKYASSKVDRKLFFKECSCEYCGEEFKSNRDLRSHYPKCEKKNHIPGYREDIQKKYTWECSICNEVFPTRRKLRNHRNTSHTKDEIQYFTGIRIKDNIGKVYFPCRYCGKTSTTKSGNTNHEKYCSKNPDKIEFISHPQSIETGKKISETCKVNKKSGGYRIGSGVGKSGWYKGYWCDSSWELAFVVYNLDHEIKFIRNTEKFKYTFNGKVKNYIPDFIMEDSTYIEVKGFDTEEVHAKIKDFPHKIKVLYEEDMKIYLDYATSRYGENFIEIYEK